MAFEKVAGFKMWFLGIGEQLGEIYLFSITLVLKTDFIGDCMALSPFSAEDRYRTQRKRNRQPGGQSRLHKYSSKLFPIWEFSDRPSQVAIGLVAFRENIVTECTFCIHSEGEYLHHDCQEMTHEQLHLSNLDSDFLLPPLMLAL